MSDEKEYDAPNVEQIPTESGPSVAAADASGPGDSGPEWRPPEEDE